MTTFPLQICVSQTMTSQEDSLGDVGAGPSVGHEGDDHGGDQPTSKVHLHWRGDGDDDDDVEYRHHDVEGQFHDYVGDQPPL